MIDGSEDVSISSATRRVDGADEIDSHALHRCRNCWPTAGESLGAPGARLHVLASLSFVDVVDDVIVQSGPPVKRLDDVDGAVLTMVSKSVRGAQDLVDE